MAAKRAASSANINSSLYDGDFQVGFDCVGVQQCRYALCSIMPPDGSEDCCFQNYGSCSQVAAQNAALKKLRDRLTKELRDRADDEQEK